MIVANQAKMLSCTRCGERKNDYKFRDGQKYWVIKCIRCELSPTGSMPIMELPEHRIDNLEIMSLLELREKK
jgi:hypothetical protein